MVLHMVSQSASAIYHQETASLQVLHSVPKLHQTSTDIRPPFLNRQLASGTPSWAEFTWRKGSPPPQDCLHGYIRAPFLETGSPLESPHTQTKYGWTTASRHAPVRSQPL